jgi:VWFA-related protein
MRPITREFRDILARSPQAQGVRGLKPFAIALFLLAPFASLQAQQDQPASSSPPTLSVTTRLVFVDVLVRDSSGKIVSGLREGDFHLSEDGKPQAIEFFSAHDRGPVYTANGVKVTPTHSTSTFSNTDQTSAAKPLTVLLFDLMNTPTDDQLFARKQMLKFLSSLPAGEHIVLFSMTNGLSMSQGVSGSPALQSAASDMLQIRNVGLDQSRDEAQQDSMVAENASAQFGLHLGSTAAQNGITKDADVDYEVRARSTIKDLGQLANVLANYPGRKSLYWVAESYPLSVDRIGVPMGPAVGDLNSMGSPAGGHANQDISGDQSHFSQTAQDEMRTTLNLLANARVAVYPTSVIGLASEASSAASPGGVENAVQNPGDPRGGFFVLNNLKSEMNDLARFTGGEAIFGTNDLAGAMQRTLDDGSIYYTLAYKPANSNWNGQFRNIRIDAGKGDSLIYRRGYFATKDAATDQPDDLTRALQPNAPEETSLHLWSKLMEPSPNAPGANFQSLVDARDVDFITSSDGHHHATLRVQMIAFADGSKQPKTLPQTSGTLNIDLDPKRFQAILAEGIAFRQALSLKPGRYSVMLGVSDEVGHKLGTLEMPVNIP